MKLCKMLREKDVGSTGIGAMIVFIATVLVAGIAASVFIQTSMKLESQAMTTGQKTIKEVSSGVAVYGIQGFVATAGGSYITNMTITVRARAGSPNVDLNETFVELADATKKMILGYSGYLAEWYDPAAGVDNVFGTTGLFPTVGNRYGILVVEDADGSVNMTTPILNRGDKVMLCISTYNVFTNGITVRKNIWGAVVPEEGSPGIIAFTTPSSYGQQQVIDLQ